jgi:transposase
MCSNCKKRGLENISVEEAGKIHALLACPSCKKVWNRDVNSARSIYSIAKHMNANDGERPEEFKRPEAATPSSTLTTIIQTSA